MDAASYTDVTCTQCHQVFQKPWYLKAHLQVEHCDDMSQKHLYRMLRYIEGEPEEEQEKYKPIGYINAGGEFVPHLKRQNAMADCTPAFSKA